jgi:uncharacterized protein (DUF305 family)
MKLTLIILIAIFIAACGGWEKTADNHAGHDGHANHSNAGANAAANNTQAPHSTAHSHSQSSPGAASAPFELQFLDSMIAHHQGAVEMAMLADGRASRPEVKQLAADIIDAQEREIAKMAEWRNGWFDGKPEAINHEFPGMSRGMGGMDVKKLGQLKGNDFDIEFIRQMIPHHEGAVEMARAVKNGKARQELQEIADDIIRTQEAEIKQMREWERSWRN